MPQENIYLFFLMRYRLLILLSSLRATISHFTIPYQLSEVYPFTAMNTVESLRLNVDVTAKPPLRRLLAKLTMSFMKHEVSNRPKSTS